MAISARIYPPAGFDYVARRPEWLATPQIVAGEDRLLQQQQIAIAESVDYWGAGGRQKVTHGGMLTLTVDDPEGKMIEGQGHFADGVRDTLIEITDDDPTTRIVWAGFVHSATETLGGTATATARLRCIPLAEMLERQTIPARTAAAPTRSLAALLNGIGTAALGTRWTGATTRNWASGNDAVILPERDTPAKNWLPDVLGAARLAAKTTGGNISICPAAPDDADPFYAVTLDDVIGDLRIENTDDIAFNTATVRYSGDPPDYPELEAVIDGGKALTGGPALSRARWGALPIRLNLQHLQRADAERIALDFITARHRPRQRLSFSLSLAYALPPLSKLFLDFRADTGPLRGTGIYGRYVVIARKIDIIRRMQAVTAEPILREEPGGGGATASPGIPPGAIAWSA